MANTFNHNRPFPAQQSQSYTPQPNGRPQYSANSPQHSTSFHGSPSPQPQMTFSPTSNEQMYPNKRQRMSPIPGRMQQIGSPVQAIPNGPNGVNGTNTANGRTGPMAPPQPPSRNQTREMDIDANGVASFGGSTQMTSSPQRAPQPSSFTSSTLTNGTSGTTGIADVPAPAPTPTIAAPPQAVPDPISQEDREQRERERKDWEESRHAQYELWDPFLVTGEIHDRIQSISEKVGTKDPQTGVMINTQRTGPAPAIKLEGLEGAAKMVRSGAPFVNTKETGERLRDVIQILSLAGRARLTGLMSTAARLALERQQYSQGRVPEDWSDIAVLPKLQETDVPDTEGVQRADSQDKERKIAKNPALKAWEDSVRKQSEAEKARAIKRRKRNAALSAEAADIAAREEAAAIDAAAAEAEKKTTKRERRAAENKISEAAQTASTNEAARMAMGAFGGKKKKYGWLTGGAGSKPASSFAIPTKASLARDGEKGKSKENEKAEESSRLPKKGLGDFDERSEAGIQARDLLAVLESDGRAAQAYVRGWCIVDEPVVAKSTNS